MSFEMKRSPETAITIIKTMELLLQMNRLKAYKCEECLTASAPCVVFMNDTDTPYQCPFGIGGQSWELVHSNLVSIGDEDGL